MDPSFKPMCDLANKSEPSGELSESRQGQSEGRVQLYKYLCIEANELRGAISCKHSRP